MGNAIANAPIASAPSPAVAAPMMANPFTRAAIAHAEMGPDNSFVLSLNQQNYGPFDIPAYGFIRALLVFVQATSNAGNSATVTSSEDAPWNVFAEISVKDINGANLVGPMDGYLLYLSHKYGGFRNALDPKLLTGYAAITLGSGGSAGVFAFQLRINIERNARDGLGALANMNSSQNYKIAGTVNSTTNIYGTTPPTVGSVTARIRVALEAWSQPMATDAYKRPNATVPPANETTGYISRITQATVAGANIIQHKRVGNYIRSLIYVNRRAGTSRVNGETDLANTTLNWYYDTRLLTSLLIEQVRLYMAEQYELILGTFETAGGLDNGVFILNFDFDFSGKAGLEMRDQWLETTTATRLECQFALPNAGVITVMTDDVAPQGEIHIS